MRSLLLLVIALGANFASAQNPAPLTFKPVNISIDVQHSEGDADLINSYFSIEINALQDSWFNLNIGRREVDDTRGISWTLIGTDGLPTAIIPPYKGNLTTVISGGRIIGDTYGLLEGQKGMIRFGTTAQPDSTGFYAFKLNSIEVTPTRSALLGGNVTTYTLPSDLMSPYIYAVGNNIPEPSVVILLLGGIGMIVFFKRKR